MHTQRTLMYTQQEELRTYTQKYIISKNLSAFFLWTRGGIAEEQCFFHDCLFVLFLSEKRDSSFFRQICLFRANTCTRVQPHTHTTTTTTHTHTPSPLNTTTHTPPVAYSNHFGCKGRSVNSHDHRGSLTIVSTRDLVDPVETWFSPRFSHTLISRQRIGLVFITGGICTKIPYMLQYVCVGMTVCLLVCFVCPFVESPKDGL